MIAILGFVVALAAVLKDLVGKLPKVSKGGTPQKPFYIVDVLKLMFELFQLARRDGVITIESHVENPHESIVFKRYPTVPARFGDAPNRHLGDV